MPKLPKIIDNLEIFAEKIIAHITENSTNNPLATVFQEAKKSYDSESSYVRSWLHSLTRKRSKDLTRMIDTLKLMPNLITQLKELENFFQLGNWESTSANTEVFIGIINAIKGYEQETSQYLFEKVVIDLKRILTEKIKVQISNYEQKEKLAKEKADEELKLKAIKYNEAELSHLFKDEDQAKLYAMKNPSHYVFYLQSRYQIVKDPKGKPRDICTLTLKWYNSNGKATTLVPNHALNETFQTLQDELLKTQNDNSGANLPDIQAHLFKKLDDSTYACDIKIECKNVLESLLAKTQVLCNPSVPKLSTFILRNTTKPITLSWVDSLGKENPVKLEDYPDFLNWLEEKIVLTDTDMLRLKVFLSDVNVRRAVNESAQTTIRSMFKEKHGITLIAVDEISTIPSYQLVKDTYILTREPNVTGAWVLYRRESGGVNAKVDIYTWSNPASAEAFVKLLNDNNVSPSILSNEIKDKLRDHIKGSTVSSQKLLCRGMKAAPTAADKLKANTIVVTREEHNYQFYYQLYYIDNAERIVKVDMRDYPTEVTNLLAKWNCEPQLLTETALGELGKLLPNFKPNRMDKSQFSNIEEAIGNRVNKSLTLPVLSVVSASVLAPLPVEKSTQAKVKIGEAIATLFHCNGSKASDLKKKYGIPPEPPIENSQEDIPPPPIFSEEEMGDIPPPPPPFPEESDADIPPAPPYEAFENSFKL